MSKGIYLISMSGSSQSHSHNCSSYSSMLYSLLVTNDDIGGGDLAVNVGDGTNFEALMITDPTDGSVHNPLIISALGLYTFETACDALQFVLSGASGALFDLYLFPKPRS